MSNWEALTDGVVRACQGTFGQSATYYQGADDAITVEVIFNLPDGLEDKFPGALPSIDVRVADFAAIPATGDEVELSGRLYKVCDVHEKEGGDATLTLQFLNEV